MQIWSPQLEVRFIFVDVPNDFLTFQSIEDLYFTECSSAYSGGVNVNRCCGFHVSHRIIVHHLSMTHTRLWVLRCVRAVLPLRAMLRLRWWIANTMQWPIDGWTYGCCCDLSHCSRCRQARQGTTNSSNDHDVPRDLPLRAPLRRPSWIAVTTNWSLSWSPS